MIDPHQDRNAALTTALRLLDRRARQVDELLRSDTVPLRSGRDEPPLDRLAEARAARSREATASLEAFLSADAELVLPTSESPAISILIVVFNRAELTFTGLLSLCSAGGPPFEVVVVDNGSTDATADMLRRVRGIRLLKNQQNHHFVRGANEAAAAAAAPTLLFLNNDAELLPGGLGAAHHTLLDTPGVGAVGGRLILPDGTLQEAGSIVWSDGSCAGYGRGAFPHHPAYMFRRDVDYVSGALLLTPRRLFAELGGFHSKFAPAYYEDADYCFRLRDAGWRVLYEPRAVAVHLEFASSQRPADAIALQRRHRAVFQTAHAERLREQLPPAPGGAVHGRSRRSAGRRILVVDDRVPHPWRGSGHPRARVLIEALDRLGHEVTFWPTADADDDWPSVYRTLPRRVEVMVGPTRGDFPAFLQERRGFYDVVLVSRPHNLRLLKAAVEGGRGLLQDARVLYDAEALFTVREITRQKVLGTPMPEWQAEKTLAEEVALLAWADGVMCVSEAEASALLSTQGVRSSVLGHSVAPAPTAAPFSTRRGFLFVGAIHGAEAPNADALDWFCAQVWPRVRKELGNVILTVVGVDTRPLVTAVEGVTRMGAKEDVTPFYAAARVFVAPTRFGAGLPLKVIEAAAFGVPVVATDLLVRQLGWTAGRDLLAGSSAESVAQACIALHENTATWERVRASALERISEDCDPGRFEARVKDIVERIAAAPPRSG